MQTTRLDLPPTRIFLVFSPGEQSRQFSSASAFSSSLELMVKDSPWRSHCSRTALWTGSVNRYQQSLSWYPIQLGGW